MTTTTLDRMEDSVLGEDLPLAPDRLFERLAMVPGYTWDQSIPPFHSSYDHWHVFGLRHNTELDTPHFTPSTTTGTSVLSSSNRGSPRIDAARPGMRHHWSSISETDSEMSSSKLEPEMLWTPVIARISSHIVRLEREFIGSKMLVKQDPDGTHTVKPLGMFRLPAATSDQTSMLVTVFEAQGKNYLRELVDFGPAFYGLAKRRVSTGGDDMTPSEQIPLTSFLDFAIGASECLEILHHGVKAVHGEVRSDSFHWNKEKNLIKLVSGGNGPRAFENLLSSEGWSTLSKELGVKNKLQYIAPEQTGRLAAEPDSRTDIYSLGVLFWIILTGRPAFEGETPIDIVQKVLSHKLPTVSSVRMDVPDVVSRVVAKMTQKQMDERYHSVSGLKYDLIQIAKFLGEGQRQELQDYEIGKRDVSAFFILPSKTFGRHSEREKIFRIIERVHKRQNTAVGKAHLNAMYSNASTSSVSESRAGAEVAFETIDGSDSSGSQSFKDSRSNSTTIGLEGAPNGKLNLLGLQSNGIAEPRTNSWASSDGESQLSAGVSSNYHDGMGNFARRRNSHKFRRRGKTEVVTLLGAQGVGKTHLIKSVQPIIRRHGYFSMSRFDKARPTPFEPMIKVMGSLFRQIFSEKDVSTSYHEMIRHHVRPIWGVLHTILDLPESLIDVAIPSKKLISGAESTRRSINTDSPSVDSRGVSAPVAGTLTARDASEFLRGPSNTKSIRFMNTYMDVLRIMCTEKVLCMCLDDIHSADEESIELIVNIIRTKTPMVFILTSRLEGDMPATTKKVLEVDSVNKMELHNLKEKHVFDYVAATLFQDLENVIPLAAVVLEKSAGNPFLMKEILQACYQKECLWYDWRVSGWQFDLDKVFNEFASEQQGCLTSSFITNRLAELPPAARSILAWASLLGNSFSFELIKKLLSGEHLYSSGHDSANDITCPQRAKTFNLSESDCVDGLQTLLDAYVLVPGETDDEYRFSHTRYLNAANELRECHNTTKMHFIISQTMMDYLSKCRFNLYPLARHISKSADLVKARVQVRAPYRDVLWRGAQTAAESGAVPTALWYYRVCIDLLQDNRWSGEATDVSYDETLQLYVNAAELFYTQRKYDEAMELLEETFKHSRSNADMTRSYILKGRMLGRMGKFSEGFQCLRTSLAGMGLEVERTSWDECDIEFKKLEFQIRNMDRHALIAQPLSEDKQTIAIGTLASEALSMVWWSDSLLWYQLVLKFTDYHLQHGGSVQIGIIYCNLAMVAINRFKDIPLALMLADMSQEFLTLYDDAWTRGRGWLLYCLFLGHFQSPLRNTLPILESALDYSLASGDKNVSVLNLGTMAMFRLFSGQDVAELESFCNYGPEEFEDWQEDLRGGTLIIASRQVARALQGKTGIEDPRTVLDDDHFHTSRWLEEVGKRTSSPDRPRDSYESITLLVYFHMGYYQETVDIGERLIATSLTYMWTHRAMASVHYYTALALIALSKEMPKDERSKNIEQAKEYKKLIDLWGSVHDVNYAAWSLILEAEIAVATDVYRKTISNYEAAIDHCQIYGFALDEAFAIELQAEFLLGRGAKRAGKVMINEAISAWSRISCTGKAKQLADKHEWLLKTATTSRTIDVGVQTEQVTTLADAEDQEQTKRNYTNSWIQPKIVTDPTESAEVPGLGLDILDLTSILEFSRVISSELQINSLLSKMTSVILECCGGQAEFAAIVIDSDNGWRIAACGDHDTGVKVYPDDMLIAEEHDQTAQHVSHYVLRTRETVFVQNVLEDERFSNVSDAYLARNPNGRAIIAIPIIQADHLMGIIHLEGRPYAFTQRNMIVLNLLTTQVSISLGNALLYRKVRKVSAANASMVESQKRALAAARDAEAKAKKAEAEAMHNVKLKEEAAKAKSIFLANVSHELRTPLNGVIGMSELLKGTPLSADQSGYADSIRVCADTLLTVINDILDFSRLEAGKMQMFAVALNLKETITEVVRALAYTNQEHGLETIEDLKLDDGLVLGDPVRLHQIFMNLLSNSYKFTPRGSVTVKARKISETREKVKVNFSVADTGIGITDEQLTRLFQPFSQADSSTQRSYGGSGLGLSICKTMIENVLGGKIWIESTPGVGTTVFFTLTFQKAPKDSRTSSEMNIAAKDPDPMANWSQSTSPGVDESKASFCDLSKVPREELRVCIAEDNAINRKIAISFVHKLGFTCEAFEDGKMAYEALQRRSKEGKPFHLVLMDVQMPVLDGYEATQAIRKDPDPRVKDVLIIAMTASAIRGDREKCIDAGMNDYLAKPVRQAALRELLNGYLTNSQAAIDKANGETAAAAKEKEQEKSSSNGVNGVAKRPGARGRRQTPTSPLSHETNLNPSPPSGKLETDTLGRISTDGADARAAGKENGDRRIDHRVS